MNINKFKKRIRKTAVLCTAAAVGAVPAAAFASSGPPQAYTPYFGCGTYCEKSCIQESDGALSFRNCIGSGSCSFSEKYGLYNPYFSKCAFRPYCMSVCIPGTDGTDTPADSGSGTDGTDAPADSGSGTDGTDAPADSGSGTDGTDAPADSGSSTDISSHTAYTSEVFTLINAERRENGLQPLSYSSEAAAVAQTKAEDMAENGYFSHTSPSYGSAFDMLQSNGISYRSAGENIAKGQTSPSSVMNSWMNSSGHRENILSSSYTSVGIGCASDSSGTLYWVQIFIG